CYVFCIYSDSITHVSLPLSLHDALPISENYHYHQCNCVSIRLSCAMRRANDLVQLVNLLASRPKFPYQARFQLRASRQRSEKVLPCLGERFLGRGERERKSFTFWKNVIQLYSLPLLILVCQIFEHRPAIMHSLPKFLRRESV